MEEAGVTHRELAAAIGKDRTMVTWTLMGRRRIALTEAATWARVLHVDVDEVMRRVGADVPHVGRAAIRVVGWADEDLRIHWGTKGLRGPKTIDGSGKGLVAIRFQGAGAFEGAVALTSEVTEGKAATIAPEVIGRICVVRIVGTTADYLRLVKHGYTVGTFNLADLRENVLEENVRLSAASVVRAISFA